MMNEYEIENIALGSSNDSLSKRILNILLVLGGISNFLGFLSNFIMFGMNIPTFFCGIFVLLIGSLFFLEKHTTNYKILASLFVLVLGIIEFPMLYFFYGRSVSPYFILPIICIIILDRSEKNDYLLSISFIIYDIVVMIVSSLFSPYLDKSAEISCIGPTTISFCITGLSCVFCVGIINNLQRFYHYKLNNYNHSLQKDVEIKTNSLLDMHNKMILGMAEMVEGRDPNTGGHIKRTSDVVKIFTNILSQNMIEEDEQFMKNIVKAAPLHDLGKIAVPDYVLQKPGKFNDDEYNLMKQHAEKGVAIIEKILDRENDADFFDIATNIAHYHHERWDGNGYPEKLVGYDIPKEARIMALVDVFDALVSERCYKKPLSLEEAFQIIQNSSGSHFDPVLTEQFLLCKEELSNYYAQFLANN